MTRVVRVLAALAVTMLVGALATPALAVPTQAQPAACPPAACPRRGVEVWPPPGSARSRPSPGATLWPAWRWPPTGCVAGPVPAEVVALSGNMTR
jgi:hypothetical protein